MKIKVAGFLFLIILLCCNTAYTGMLLNKVVAVVNKEVITWGDLYKEMAFEASSKMDTLSEEEKRKVFKENEAAFLESLIDIKLQLQAAKQSLIELDESDVDATIADIKKRYDMDDKGLSDSLQKEGLTFSEYRNRLGIQILLNTVINQQVRNKIVVSDSEIKKFLEYDKNAMEEGESYRVRHIFLKKPVGGDKKTLEEKSDAILSRLKKGEDFSALAAESSDSPTAKSGGDIGYIKKGHIAKEFSEALLNMKAGDISKPFWTDMGLNIIKLEEKVDAFNNDEYKESVRKKLLEKRFNEDYRNWLRGLRERAFIEIRL